MVMGFAALYPSTRAANFGPENWKSNNKSCSAEAMTKIKTSNKLFTEIADELAFSGKGATRFIEFSSYYLLINHQKSTYNKCFYINIGLIYKEILGRSLTAEDIVGAFSVKSPTIPIHVSFRLNRFPSAPPDLQEKLDKLIMNDSILELKNLLLDVFKRLLTFIKNSHDRRTIRKLYEEKKLSASILKEV